MRSRNASADPGRRIARRSGGEVCWSDRSKYGTGDSATVSMGGDQFYGPGPPSLTGMLTFAFLDALVPQPVAFSSVNGGSYRVVDDNNQEIGRLEWDLETVEAVLVPTPVPIPGTGMSVIAAQ